MNKNQYPANANLGTVSDLSVGDHFVYNWMGGNRTVYRVERVSGTTVTYTDGTGASPMMLTLSGLSTLVLL